MRVEVTSRIKEFDLPWSVPLAQWPADLFIAQDRCPGEEWRLKCGEANYVALEVPAGKGRNAFDLLSSLGGYDLPVAAPLALVEDRARAEDLLVLELPKSAISLGETLLDDGENVGAKTKAVAALLVHLHLAGVAGEGHARWRFACCNQGGQAYAYLVYGEGSMREDVDPQSRMHDADALLPTLRLAAGEAFFRSDAALAFSADTYCHYERMWQDIQETRLFIDEDIQLRTRVASLDKVPASQRTALGAGNIAMTVRCQLMDGSDHHQMLLQMLTGLETSGERGKSVLRDIFRYHSWLEFTSGKKWPRALAANRWVSDCFLPAISLLPAAMSKNILGRVC